jgi:glutathione S-transferase
MTSAAAPRLCVYGDLLSGNCYKVALLLSHLGIDHDWVHVDILSGGTRTTEFLAMNPNGKLPLLALGDGRYLAESNAILHYLADDSALLPSERWPRAQVLQWQFFEQYSHEPYIATARFIAKYLGLPAARRAEYDAKQAGGHAALGVMERHLTTHDYFVGAGFTIADISLYAYTHVAPEGGFSLDGYPHVRAWLARVVALPGHLAMPRS